MWVSPGWEEGGGLWVPCYGFSGLEVEGSCAGVRESVVGLLDVAVRGREDVFVTGLNDEALED